MTIQLRQYQEDGLNAVWKYFAEGNNGNPVIAWPTGTGKSIVPAIFIKRTMELWPNQRFLMITHVKELIEQNYEVLKFVWPNAPVGIYSAGLKQKDNPIFPIIFGGIQSMIKNPAQFGHRDIIFIDECHLVSQEESSMYLTFLATMKLINPLVKIIGMSATPFRMGMGYIVDGGLFTDIVHDLTKLDAFTKLIVDGFLCPIVPLRTKTQLDVSGVGMAKGEFIAGQLQHAVDRTEITLAGLKELVAAGQNRKSWLIFASGIEHAEHIAEMLGGFGIDCAPVHSKREPDYNDAAIKAFKSGQLRSIVNFSKLTTGFNHPSIDLIGDFRPTMSIPLHVQKLGRGTRPAPNKIDCLGLDFAANVPRLGPINDPIIPRKKGEAQGEAPIKLCNSCGAYNHAAARNCCQCGIEFEFKVKIKETSGTAEFLRSDLPVTETFDVNRVVYKKRQRKDQTKPPYIAVTYYSNSVLPFTENVFPEHSEYAKHLFHNWWRQRHPSEPPLSSDDVIKYQNSLRMPKRIRVWVNKKPQPEVLGCEF